jgi:hypothetical protein
LSHHAREGKPDDIEQFAYRPGWKLPLGLLFGNWFYYSVWPKCSRRERSTAVAAVIASTALLLLWPRPMLLGWFVPMQLVVCFTMVTNIYLPHGRFANWVMTHIPFLTGYHEDHHALPSYPWHQISQRAVRSSQSSAPSFKGGQPIDVS